MLHDLEHGRKARNYSINIGDEGSELEDEAFVVFGLFLRLVSNRRV